MLFQYLIYFDCIALNDKCTDINYQFDFNWKSQTQLMKIPLRYKRTQSRLRLMLKNGENGRNTINKIESRISTIKGN